MTNYFQLRNQIQKLQKEAEVILKRERTEAIAKIREAIVAYELTAKDLGLSDAIRGRTVRKSGKKAEGLAVAAAAKHPGGPPKSAAAPRGSRKAGRKTTISDKRSVVAPKYRDSTTGTTWAGRGRQPKWLAAAIKDGKKLEDFKV